MAQAWDQSWMDNVARQRPSEPLTATEIALIKALARRQARVDVVALMAPETQELIPARRPLRPV